MGDGGLPVRSSHRVLGTEDPEAGTRCAAQGIHTLPPGVAGGEEGRPLQGVGGAGRAHLQGA